MLFDIIPPIWVLLCAFVCVLVWACFKMVSLEKQNVAYRTKCEASGGVVYHSRGEPQKCMKKEFFIDMSK